MSIQYKCNKCRFDFDGDCMCESCQSDVMQASYDEGYKEGYKEGRADGLKDGADNPSL